MGAATSVNAGDATPPTPGPGPAFYAEPWFLRRARLRQWWTVLHPPYTMLHLSLVTIGAGLRGPVNAGYLAATLLAFFLALGVGAHSLDELRGRPLRTTIPSTHLIGAAVMSLGFAIALGIAGMVLVSPYLALFIVIGTVTAVGYNLELWNGRLHNRTVLVLGWGGFPVLTAYYAQHSSLSVGSFLAAGFGVLVTLLQQQLSTPARTLRRRVARVEGVLVHLDGTTSPLTTAALLVPLESGLWTLCWTGVAMALALMSVRFIR